MKLHDCFSILKMHLIRQDYFTYQEHCKAVMHRLNCAAPIPHGHPGADITFWGVAAVFNHFFDTLPTLINHFNPFIFECPALFYHTHFSSDPGAEQFDRRITTIQITCARQFAHENEFEKMLIMLKIRNSSICWYSSVSFFTTSILNPSH